MPGFISTTITKPLIHVCGVVMHLKHHFADHFNKAVVLVHYLHQLQLYWTVVDIQLESLRIG